MSLILKVILYLNLARPEDRGSSEMRYCVPPRIPSDIFRRIVGREGTRDSRPHRRFESHVVQLSCRHQFYQSILASQASHKTIPFAMTSVAKIPLRFKEAFQLEGVDTIIFRGKGWSTAAVIHAPTWRGVSSVSIMTKRSTSLSTPAAPHA